MIKRKPLTEEQKEAARKRASKHYYANRDKKLEYQRQYSKRNKGSIKKRKKKNASEYASLYGWLKHKFEGIPCSDCEGVFPYCSMDFDHRSDEKKEFNISYCGSALATPERTSKWMKEIDKCDLVCANCHRIRTQERSL